MGHRVPDAVQQLVGISAVVRAPGVSALDAQVDALARSIRFTSHAPPLVPAEAGKVLRTIVDYIDQDTQKSNQSTFYACFPRSPGERKVTIDRWWGEVLAGPTAVTCASAIEATDVALWRVSLSITWDAGSGYAAGEWREAIYADAAGTWIGQEELTDGGAPKAGLGPTPSPSG